MLLGVKQKWRYANSYVSAEFFFLHSAHQIIDARHERNRPWYNSYKKYG